MIPKKPRTNQNNDGSCHVKSRGATTKRNATTPRYVPMSAAPTSRASMVLATSRVTIPAVLPW